jgi:hypothetical protein
MAEGGHRLEVLVGAVKEPAGTAAAARENGDAGQSAAILHSHTARGRHL